MTSEEFLGRPPVEAPQRQLYGGYTEESEYIVEENCLYLLKAEDPPTNPDLLASYEPYVKIQLAPKTRRRIVKVFGEKTGTPPLMPAPADSGRFKFEEGSLSFSRPQPTLDGVSCLWQASATYSFVENALPSVYQGYVLGEPSIAVEAYETAKNSRYARLTAAEGLKEQNPGPRLGEVMGTAVDFTKPDLGLSYTNGAYSVLAYVPSAFFSDRLIAGGKQGLPPVPPPPPPGSPPP